MKYEDLPRLFGYVPMAVESTPGFPVEDGKSRSWTFKPNGVVHVPRPMAMHIEMQADGVHVIAEYKTNEALLSAFKSFLEQNGYTVTEIE